jgi:hypothetical protein
MTTTTDKKTTKTANNTKTLASEKVKTLSKASKVNNEHNTKEVLPKKQLNPPQQQQEEQDGGKKMNKKRTFKIKLDENEFCSRIVGNTPKQAASKALTLIFNKKKQIGGQKLTKGKVIFVIKETTRGSKGKEYTYQGERVKLKEPTTYVIRSPAGDKTIVNRFRNIIEKYTVATPAK